MTEKLLEQIRVLEEQVRTLRILAEKMETQGKVETGPSFSDLKGLWKDYGPIDESEIDAVLYRLKEDLD
ncbi:hypothetical protein FJY63_11485 [Candidatus Sumerlaeota bacterium]|nr:hypothetical protein [Candidatus Sumerlaeota bacterium]